MVQVLEINFWDRQWGLTVSSVICDHCCFSSLNLWRDRSVCICLSVTGVWNMLPPAITSLPSLQTYKRALKMDGAVSQIVRQRTLAAIAALTSAYYVKFTAALKFCLRLVSPWNSWMMMMMVFDTHHLSCYMVVLCQELNFLPLLPNKHHNCHPMPHSTAVTCHICRWSALPATGWLWQLTSVSSVSSPSPASSYSCSALLGQWSRWLHRITSWWSFITPVSVCNNATFSCSYPGVSW